MPGDAMFGTGPGGGPTGERRGPLPTSTIPPQKMPGGGGYRKKETPPKITQPKSSRSSSDEELVSHLRNLFVYARNSKRTKYENWQRNYKLVNNRISGGGQPGQPNPRSSEIYPTLSSLNAWMTDQHVNVDFITALDPSYTGYIDLDTLANDLSSVFYSSWMAERNDRQVSLMLWDTMMFGVGITKSVWDQSLAGGYGNAVLKRVDPYSGFYPDPDASCIDDMSYCVELSKVTYEELERRYPDTCHLVSGGAESFPDDGRPKDLSGGTSGSGVREGSVGSLPSSGPWPGTTKLPTVYGQPKNNRYGARSPYDTYTLYEFWLRENEEWEEDRDDVNYEEKPDLINSHINDQWRVVVMCNGQILMDEMASDLWSYAGHPYDRYVMDDIGEFYGICLVDHLAYPQVYINRLLTALQQNAELVGNPIFVESAGSGLNRVRVINQPGQRLTLSGPAAMANRPDWLAPPQMPPVVMELVNFWLGRIENTSGLNALQKGTMPNQRAAEGVVQNITEAASTRIRMWLQQLEWTLQGAAGKLADLIIDNYTEPRVMAILGPDGQRTAMALRAHHFMVPGPDGSTPLQYAVMVNAGSRSPSSRQGKINEALELYTLGAVDDQYVAEAFQVRNVPAILKRLYDKRIQGLVGGGPGQRQKARSS